MVATFLGVKDYKRSNFHVQYSDQRHLEGESVKSKLFCKFTCFLGPFLLTKIFPLFLSQQGHNLDWFPHLRCMSLSADDTENEQNDIRNLQIQLESTNVIVHTLSKQLTELREQVG